MSLSLACLVLFAAACSSNKEKGADSDSIVTVATEEVDSTLADSAAADSNAVEEAPAQEAQKPAAKKSNANKPKKNNNKSDNKTTEPNVATDQDKAAMNAAIKQTKKVVEAGVNDASDKAKSWKDKKKNQNN